VSHPPSIPPADPSATPSDIVQRDSHQLRHGRLGVYAASQFGLLIGNPESPLRWILPALIIVAAIAGVFAAINLKRRAPDLYAQMGRHRDIELLPGA
jgi:hypothetical protein